MTSNDLYTGDVWKKLMARAQAMDQPQNHLKYLIDDPDRLTAFSLSAADVFFDFSRQRLDRSTLELLFELARTRGVPEKFTAMTRGKKLNITENRAALHTATRDFSSRSLYLDGKDILSELRQVNRQIKAFTHQVHQGSICGSTGKRFRHVVVIGIGGSYLGTEFVSTALRSYADRDVDLHYLSNVDIHNFGAIAAKIDPETTLWLIISKSYTTAETLANEALARAFMTEKGIDPTKHIVTVTAKGSPGDNPDNPVLQSFNMFDFIGGRYSVCSAVGALPLSLYLGYDRFERFLKGAEAMDSHALGAPVQENIPLVAALIAIWNNNFLNYPAQAIIAYSDPLAKLAPHVQQLNMESNGKMVNTEGVFMEAPCGTLIFGEPGTNAQHSFFQLAHQGRVFPIDFIGVIHPRYPQFRTLSKGITNHQELWANLLSQPMALATGKEDKNPARCFPGNRPSSTLILKDLSPESIGKLLSFYEARTVFEAFVWDINPFDQFGVELGKVLAGEIRKQMAARNKDSRYAFDSSDPITRFYLKMLYAE
jgi:glucose-6-phosphate isomerase